MTEDERLEDKIARVELLVESEQLRENNLKLKSENEKLNKKKRISNLGETLFSYVRKGVAVVLTVGMCVGSLYGAYRIGNGINGWLDDREKVANLEIKYQQDKVNRDQQEIISADYVKVDRLIKSFLKAMCTKEKELLKEFFHCHYSVSNHSDYNLMETVVNKDLIEGRCITRISSSNPILNSNQYSPERDYSALLHVEFCPVDGKPFDIEGESSITCDQMKCSFVLKKTVERNCPDYVGVIK